MLDVFYKQLPFSYRVMIPSNTSNVNDRLRDYLYDVMSWFKSNAIRVSSENILYRLIHTMGIDATWSNTDILYYMDTIEYNLIKPFSISSDINIDLIHPNNSIIKRANEVIYKVDEYDTLYLANGINESNWMDMSPLLFKNHSYRDLYFNHPTRMDMPSGNTDIIVYTLDFKLLAIMYKYYVLQQKTLGLFTSIGEFIARYVYTNAMISMVDITLLNNYLNKGDIYLPNRQSIGATSINTNTTMLYGIINKSLINRERDRLNLIEVLLNIPLLHSDGYSFLILPKNFYETSRSKKYISLVLLDYIKFVLNRIEPYSDGNSQYFTKLKYYIKTLLNMSISTTELIDNKVLNTLNEIKEKL